MLIKTFCEYVCHLPATLVNEKIIPGAALSVLLGNLFYFWQARRLAAKTGRDDITALPYGINTPSLIAYVFLVMAPAYAQTGNAEFTWRIGLFACLLSGLMETIGAFVGDWIRRHTPRAALLTALAGIALTFIAVGFVFQIFASPLTAVPPMLLILIAYAGRLRLPFNLPGGFVAVAVGVALAWLFHCLGWAAFQPKSDATALGLYLPQACPTEALALLGDAKVWRYLAVIIPMGLFNVIGSLQNLESAEAAGDRFETRPSLLANGLGTLTAAFFGSPFPTTIYIGHPGWKAMGARSAYSALNGIVIALLCLCGGVTMVLKIVPIEVTLGILVWIGIIITAQAFQAVPQKHALAVAFGLVPAFAAWALDMLIKPVLLATGGDINRLFAVNDASNLFLPGIVALSQGFLLSAMVWAALLVFVIERQFLRAAAWALVAAGLSMIGLIHAYTLTEAGIENCFGWAAAPKFAAAYVLTALVLALLHVTGVSKAQPAGDHS
jgi:AGZA family xanthine/uracil permease-like MFS transporter